MEMESEASELYIKAIEVIEAQNMLLQMKIADYPNMKQSDRRKLFKTLYEKAYPNMDQEKKAIRVEDFALAMIGKK